MLPVSQNMSTQQSYGNMIHNYFLLLEDNRNLHNRIIRHNETGIDNMYRMINNYNRNFTTLNRQPNISTSNYQNIRTSRGRFQPSPLNNNNSIQPNNILTNILNQFDLQPTRIEIEERFLNTLQPVAIIPTLEQINRASENRVFNTILNPPNDTCPILREPFNPNDQVLQILECKHCFNPPALRRWFRTSPICPVCRFDIREYNPTNVIRNPYATNNTDTINNTTNTRNNNTDTINNTTNNTIYTTNNPDTNNPDTNNPDTNNPDTNNPDTRINNNFSNEQINTLNNLTEQLLQPINNLPTPETMIDASGNLNIIYQFDNQ
tara:strand:+ start:2447 stop:3409 length:963 start_codon:yes stop_codon:yes gene_type:complete